MEGAVYTWGPIDPARDREIVKVRFVVAERPRTFVQPHLCSTRDNSLSFAEGQCHLSA